MNKTLRYLLICSLLCFSWAASVQAEEENDGVGMLIHITAKDGHDEALIKGITDCLHLCFAKRPACAIQKVIVQRGMVDPFLFIISYKR